MRKRISHQYRLVLMAYTYTRLAIFIPLLLLAACTSDPLDFNEPSNNTQLTEEEALHISPEEMERTWRAALVRIPDGSGGVTNATMDQLESGEVAPSSHSPVLIWLHGCNGFWSGTHSRINWFAQNGFVVIAPSSFARSFYPQSCDVATNTSGMYRPTLQIRQNDAGYAITKARSFDWADTNNLFLAGLSEGAAVATTYTNLEHPEGYLKARIAEGWGCHAGWPEFEGINAPQNEAVLTLLADHDPWYTSSYHQGNCGEFMTSPNGSQSFLVDYTPLRYSHTLWEATEIKEIILNFLQAQLQRK